MFLQGLQLFYDPPLIKKAPAQPRKRKAFFGLVKILFSSFESDLKSSLILKHSVLAGLQLFYNM